MVDVREAFGSAGILSSRFANLHVRHPHRLATEVAVPQHSKGTRTMEDSAAYAIKAAHPSDPQKFLSLAADYQIAADSESASLMDDTALFLEYAREAVSTIANGLEDKGSDIAANPKSAAVVLRGVGRFIEMAASNVSAVNGRLNNGRRA